MDNIPEGYKQTEVGVIPVDWEVETLGDIFTFGGGYSASWDQLSSDGYCYLHYGDIHKSAKSFIDVRAEYPDIPKLNILLKRISPKSLLHNGDIVFVDASEDDEGTSKHIVVVNNEDITYISGLHTIVAKSKVAVLDNGYKRYCFQSRDIKKQFYFYSVGTKVSGISKTNIAKLKLPIPPLPEQQAIASALSDVDALITALEQLITKKRNIKQGAMQQLLTGKKRLPGFSGEWEAKRLGDCLSKNPDYGINAPSVPYSDNLPVYIRITDISDDGRFMPEKITSVDNINSNNYFLEKDDLVFARTGASTGKTYLYNPKDGKLVFAGFLIRVKVDSQKLHPQFLKSYTETTMYWNWVNIMSMRSGQPGINGNEYSQLPILLPPLPEQTAIATILSDMDTEIEALEQKRDKYRALKQGMMQELLTGKTRLV